MTRVIAALCRHGEYEQPAGVPSAHLPHPLTERGRGQAVALAEQLQTLCDAHGWQLWPVLDSSPLLRASQTASLAATALSNAGNQAFCVEEFSALTERCVGAAANLTVDAIEAIIARDPRYPSPPVGWKSSSDYRLPFVGAESLLQAGARCAEHLRNRADGLRTGARDATIVKVFVGHGAAFRHAAIHLGALALDDMPRLSMHHARPVCLATDETANWSTSAGEWKLRKRAPDSHPSTDGSDHGQPPAPDAEPLD